nr:MAG TPA: PRK protein [Caudoviricetes sp.]
MLIQKVKDKKCLFIDIDNTIYSYTFANAKALEAVLKNFKISEEDYQKARNELSRRKLKVNMHKKELTFKTLCNNLKMDFRKSIEMKNLYEKTFYNNILLDAEVLKLLQYCYENKIKVIAITNFYYYEQFEKLQKFNILKYFDNIITSEEFEKEKPNKTLIDYCLKISETNKEDCIMIGDSECDDFSFYDIDSYTYNCSKLLISISGKSGAGKSTLSKILKDIFNGEIIEGDGYHKYDRFAQEWKSLTHYNPEANNLVKLGTDIKNIYQNLNVKVPIYNHDTGLFENPRDINSNDLDCIIIDGLHTLYPEVAQDYVKFKIFIDSDKSDNQKILRDVKERNKSKENVLKSIQERESDYLNYIYNQKEYANFIIEIKEDNVKIHDKLMNKIYLCNFNELNDKISEIFKLYKNNRFVNIKGV